MNPDALLVVGSGAMACLFAARLSAAGFGVTMLGTWAEGIEALQRAGVRLQEAGAERSFAVRAVSDPAECRGTRRALVLCKAWQTQSAAARLAECLAPDGLALTLQNGLGNREALAALLGEDRAAIGITTQGATLIAPGVVRPVGEPVIRLGAHPRLEPLAAALSTAGFEIETSPDVDGLLWGKLVINAAINPLTALLRVPNGALLERPPARELLQALACETAAVAAARGVQLPFADPVQAAEAVARRTAANRSSMLQDVERGAPTEIDAICGAVVQAGERLQLPTPFNRTLLRLVQSLRIHGS